MTQSCLTWLRLRTNSMSRLEKRRDSWDKTEPCFISRFFHEIKSMSCLKFSWLYRCRVILNSEYTYPTWLATLYDVHLYNKKICSSYYHFLHLHLTRCIFHLTIFHDLLSLSLSFFPSSLSSTTSRLLFMRLFPRVFIIYESESRYLWVWEGI